MARFKNAVTGVTVQASDEVAARLSAEWRPVDEVAAGSGVPDKSWTVKQLKAYAAEHDIDLDGATRKVDILDILDEVAAGSGVPDESDED